MGASGQVDKLNQSFSKLDSGAGSAAAGIKRFITAAGGLFALKQGMAVTDEFTNTQARLNQINDGLQSQKELQDNIYVAAQRSRGAYDAMSASVAKLGMMAGDAFSSTQEIIDFTELVNKSFKVGGASKGEQEAGMYQLSQAMASGRLQGDEFRSISENAPAIMQALSKSLDVPIGKLKEMGSEGELTADVIKRAMFDMADDINSQFEKMPLTFSDVGTQIKNHAIYTFQGVMESANEILNSDNIQNFVNAFKGSIDILAWSVEGLLQLINNIATAVSDSWAIIEPILLTAAMILIPYLVAQLWLMVQPLIVAAAAWLMMNAPIVLIIGLIALFIFALQQAGVTTGEIVGNIAGTFWALGAVVYNVFAMMYNISSSFCNFFGNVFKHPLLAVQKLFYEMGMYIMQIIRGIAQQIENLINAIPGVEVSITGKLDGVVNWYKNAIKDIDDKAGFEDFTPKMELKNVNDSFNKGFDWGNNAVSSIGGGGFEPPGMNTSMDLGDYMSGGALPVTNGKGGSGGSLNVSIDKEDIKYLKDIAERDYVAKYTQATLAPNVKIEFGDVHENADAGKVAGIIEKILKEEIAIVQEG